MVTRRWEEYTKTSYSGRRYARLSYANARCSRWLLKAGRGLIWEGLCGDGCEIEETSRGRLLGSILHVHRLAADGLEVSLRCWILSLYPIPGCVLQIDWHLFRYMG